MNPDPNAISVRSSDITTDHSNLFDRKSRKNDCMRSSKIRKSNMFPHMVSCISLIIVHHISFSHRLSTQVSQVFIVCENYSNRGLYLLGEIDSNISFMTLAAIFINIMRNHLQLGRRGFLSSFLDTMNAFIADGNLHVHIHRRSFEQCLPPLRLGS